MIKMNLYITRRADLSFEQFSDYWMNVHWPIVSALPEVRAHTRRYVQQHKTGSLPPGLPEAPFDGIAEAWFDDMDAAFAVTGSANWANIVAKDDENFLDTPKTKLMFTTEKVIFQP